MLKIALPLAFGLYLVWFFYDKLSEDDKNQMISAFGRANYFWILLGLVPGILSHLSRAWRWRYALEPLGYKPGLRNSFLFVMSGYLINFALPRAGEASRCAMLYRYDKVPFAKGFGTVMAERVIDLGMLGLIALTTLALQMDKLDVFRNRIETFKAQTAGNNSSFDLGQIITGLILAGIIVVIILLIFKPSIRKKVFELLQGMWQGLLAVVRMKRKWSYIAHTIFIWAMYLLMFALPFQSLDATSGIELNGILAAFVAGTLGIVVVQGGLGVYPALVGLIVTVYVGESDQFIHPEGLALGWLIWVSQTVMTVVVGAVCLFLAPRLNRKKELTKY